MGVYAGSTKWALTPLDFWLLENSHHSWEAILAPIPSSHTPRRVLEGLGPDHSTGGRGFPCSVVEPQLWMQKVPDSNSGISK